MDICRKRIYAQLGKTEERSKWMEKANAKLDDYMEGEMQEAEEEKERAVAKERQGETTENKEEAEASDNEGLTPAEFWGKRKAGETAKGESKTSTKVKETTGTRRRERTNRHRLVCWCCIQLGQPWGGKGIAE